MMQRIDIIIPVENYDIVLYSRNVKDFHMTKLTLTLKLKKT